MMMMYDAAYAEAQGWMDVNPDAGKRTPREDLLHMALCNGLQPVNFTSDGWAHAFVKSVHGTEWTIWRAGISFTSARLITDSDGIERYGDIERHASFASAIRRLTALGRKH